MHNLSLHFNKFSREFSTHDYKLINTHLLICFCPNYICSYLFYTRSLHTLRHKAFSREIKNIWEQTFTFSKMQLKTKEITIIQQLTDSTVSNWVELSCAHVCLCVFMYFWLCVWRVILFCSGLFHLTKQWTFFNMIFITGYINI